MASTHGYKPKPLPDSFLVGVRELGFRQMMNAPADEPPMFKHPQHPRLWVSAATTNIPGDPYVIARWGNGDERWMLRIGIDSLLKELGGMVHSAEGVNRFMGRSEG